MEQIPSGQWDALFCNSARIGEVSRNTHGSGEKSRPLLLWRERAGGLSGSSPESEFKTIELPQPILRSNLEPLLLQLVLQRKCNRG
jgi:hypothetical protein